MRRGYQAGWRSGRETASFQVKRRNAELEASPAGVFESDSFVGDARMLPWAMRLVIVERHKDTEQLCNGNAMGDYANVWGIA